MQKDRILALIYNDFQLSMNQVRCGADPGAIFRDHEWRVAPLRKLAAEFEALAPLPGTDAPAPAETPRAASVTAFVRRKLPDQAD